MTGGHAGLSVSQRESVRKGKLDAMAQQNKQSQFQQPSPRTTIISVVLFMLVAFFVGQQFLNMSSAGAKPTDRLITSEFVQAVEQDRATKVVYNAGDYTVSGSYYPAITAGSTGADAFNEAFQALNARMATLKNPETGKALGGVGTTDINGATLGVERNFTSTYYGGSLGDLMAAHPNVPYEVALPSPFVELLGTLLPFIIIGLILFFFFNQMQKANNSQMSFGKAKTKKSIEERPDVKFSDVAGVDEAVEEMQEIKDFLANPAKYQSMGAKIPRGCLLVGPPGTGKTLLARAVAGEAGVPFFSISGSDFVEMFVGVGASRVRDLFQQAKDASPAIIFIDEIDAVGRQRGTGLGGGHDEREQTLNQLLVEMDGFGANEGVIVIAATNRADILDKALLRPGRFDRQVYVGLPDIKGREEILKVHTRNKPLAPDVNLETIAKSTAGFTGADLENLLNEAALLAARKERRAITMAEIEEATIKVVVGTEKKSRIMSDKEKKLTAYHEAGHAVATYYCDSQDPVHQISIIPRGMAGGYTMHLPTEDKSYKSRNEMKEELIVLLGGRVAEALVLDDISTGASNDIERATKIVRAMVTKYGMSERLGPITYGTDTSNPFLGKEMGHVSNYSEETAAEIDEEVKSIIFNAYQKTEKVLSDHIDVLHRLAGVLFEKEKLDADEFIDVIEGRLLPSGMQAAEPAAIPAESAPESAEEQQD